MDSIRKLGELAGSLGCTVRYGEPMSRHTTFRIGGPADLFLSVPGEDALERVCGEARRLGVRVLPIGNGSNSLVRDEGIRGAVLSLEGEFRKITLCEGNRIRCGAGASLSELCNFARDRSLTGIEFAWGIPGAVGGAAFMNAGAYEHSLGEAVAACEHVTPEGLRGSFSGGGLVWGYRRSAYTENGAVITFVTFALEPGDRSRISATMDDLYARRKSRQPLDMPSAGSVFKRPEGHFAGTLIEQCGLKGRRVGGAMVSEKHAGFIVNAGGATCGDVLKLIGVIQETVYGRTGVKLECEVKTIG